MNIPISPRLLACCSYIRPGDRVADVGCDHGYLGIYLLHCGIAKSVIASDLREGPLKCAVENAEKFGVSSRMRFFLSNGAAAIDRDFDTLVCAGMGAETMISILQAAPWLRSEQYRLVLQCQTKTHLLRQYLSDTGWEIRDEAVRRDGRFLYTVINAQWNPAAPRLTPGQYYASPAMMREDTEQMWEHFLWIYKELYKITTSRGAAAGETMTAALEELTRIRDSREVTS